MRNVITNFRQAWGNNFHQMLFGWDISDNSARQRLILLMQLFIIAFAILIYRLIIISNRGYIKTTEYHNEHHLRREIVDSNNKILAISLPSASLFAKPADVIQPEQAVAKLVQVIPQLDKSSLLQKLRGSKNFIWVARDLSPTVQKAVAELGLPGFSLEQEKKRIYPFGAITSHLVGYVGRDHTGLAGIESSYNEFLHSGTAVSARPLKLSIDVRLQAILSEEIEQAMQQFDATGATGIVADPNTGAVLAMVSKPDFDPHNFNKAASKQLFNTASLGVYEIGSVFKILTMAIGFDTQTITMRDAYDISYMKVGNYQITDYHPQRGWHSVAEIFMHSSNIGVSQIMLEIGQEKLKRYLKNLGLFDQLQIELPERGVPLFPVVNKWNEVSLATMSYGYGISMSPLHFVQAILPVVNGGYFYPLTLIKKDTAPLSVRVFNENTSKQMLKLLRLTVKSGNSTRADIKGYLVGGKTGTAHKIVNGKYSKNSRMSSFLGVLPASAPKYVVYVMLDNPRGTKDTYGFATAGWNAAPTVGRIFTRMISLYGLSQLDESSEEMQDIFQVDYKVYNET